MEVQQLAYTALSDIVSVEVGKSKEFDSTIIKGKPWLPTININTTALKTVRQDLPL